MTKQFQWTEETINYFVNLEELNGMKHVSTRVLEFIEKVGYLHPEETTLDLYNDIMTKVENLLQNQYD